MHENFRFVDTILVSLLMLLGALVLVVLYLITLQRTLAAISPHKRSLHPGLVWLMLVPFFNIVWNFILVSRLANSINAEFNPDYAVEIVMRAESSIKTGIPARFFFESVVTPTVRRKIEEMPVFAGISGRNRFSIA